MEYYEEKDLKEYPKIISFEGTEKILEQMKKSICKIKLINGGIGTGFFCKIPFPTADNMYPVLITNNHVINEELLKQKNGTFLISTKEHPKYKIFDLENRRYFTSKKYDVTFIEIKANIDNIHSFLDIDENIIENAFDDNINENDNPNINFVKETLYILQYPEEKLSVSYGIMNEIIKGNYSNFKHLCSTKGGSSGSPILNITNHKVIGIHCQGGHNDNKGIFLDYSIREFIKDNKNFIYSNNIINEKNEIKLENSEAGNFNLLGNNEIINDVMRGNLINYEKINNDIIKSEENYIKLNEESENAINKIIKKTVMNLHKDKAENINKNKYELKSGINITLEQFKKKYNIFVQDNKAINIDLENRKAGNDILDILCILKFHSIKYLRINNNNISNIDALELFQCYKLEELYLENNKIEDINVLEKVNLPELRILNLSENLIKNIDVFDMVYFPNLEQLNLQNNQISDISVFKKTNFLKLTSLYLSQNIISDISGINVSNFPSIIIF